jgi:hypothetical protein
MEVVDAGREQCVAHSSLSSTGRVAPDRYEPCGHACEDGEKKSKLKLGGQKGPEIDPESRCGALHYPLGIGHFHQSALFICCWQVQKANRHAPNPPAALSPPPPGFTYLVYLGC